MHGSVDSLLDGEGALEQVHRLVIMPLKHQRTAQYGLCGGRLRMILAVPGFGDGERFPFQALRFGVVSAIELAATQIDQRIRYQRMAFTESSSVNGESAPVQCVRIVVMTGVEVRVGE